MTTAEAIFLACVIVGSALSWLVSGWLHFEKGTAHGRELESLDQMCRSKPVIFGGGEVYPIAGPATNPMKTERTTEPLWTTLFRRYSNAHFATCADEYREGAGEAGVIRRYNESNAAENAFLAEIDRIAQSEITLQARVTAQSESEVRK